MKILRISLVILLILIFMGVIAGGVFVRYSSRKGLPDYNKNIPLDHLSDSVVVFRDSTAMPHVYAENEADLYRTVGYLMAQDRLWQMDLLRRLTQGRLAEILGKDLARTDLLFRALHFSQKSQMVLEKSPVVVVSILQSFSDGVNQYLEDHKGKLPPEFSILGYEPEPWEPIHSVNLIGYMSWSLTMGWTTEITLFRLKQFLEPSLFAELLPDMDLQKIYVIDNGETELAHFTTGMEDAFQKITDLGLQVFQASNNWAVAGSKSSSGHALLANDMHLDLNLPGIWYQMHQVVPGKLNVSGVVLPGQPFIICGHNEKVAWGMTNVMVDNMDFYLETIHPSDSSCYRLDGEWKKLRFEEETIFTKEGDTLKFHNQFTHRGPVISRFKDLDGPVVSMRWSGNDFSNELESVYLFNRMSNWEEFRNAARNFISISQNIAYADIDGNVGLQIAAGIPIREGEGIFIVNGDTSQYDWKGMVPFEELPYVYNPPSGWVASANNRTIDNDFPYYISRWYDLPNRVEKIREQLDKKELLNVQDMKALQANQDSKWVEKILPFFLRQLSPYLEDASGMMKEAVSFLENWNYRMSVEAIEPLLFEQWYFEFVKGLFKDEMGEELFTEFIRQDMLISMIIEKISLAGQSVWCDNIQTSDKIETVGEIVYEALENAIDELSDRLGKDMMDWQWGKLHTLSLEHPLGGVDMLNRAFKLNLGPFPVGGSYHTVSPYSYSFKKLFSSKFGSSQRHIFVAGDWDKSLLIIPTGNSGIPASPHYGDQTALYLTYRYKNELFSKEAVEGSRKYISVFYPE